MKISNNPPPNYKEIKKHFPNADFYKGTLFTYGDTCYCKNITPDLIVHEETHSRQQVNPKKWWRRYFSDPEFRLSQEIEAYHNQWKWVEKNVKDRNAKFKILHKISQDLSGSLYGNIISFGEAQRRIIRGR